MKAILIGYGEVGQGLEGALRGHHSIEVHDPSLSLYADTEKQYDLMLVAIPFGGLFEEIVKGYQLLFRHSTTVIFSSVPVGTSRKVGALHSPIEGRRTNMVAAIRYHTRWIGGTLDSESLAVRFFQESRMLTCLVEKQETTEFLKLASTTIYGINIEWARYMKQAADRIGFDYQLVKNYNYDYDQLVRAYVNPNLRRYNLDAPEGRIGGHCIINNAKILEDTDFCHPFIRYMNNQDRMYESQVEFNEGVEKMLREEGYVKSDRGDKGTGEGIEEGNAPADSGAVTGGERTE